MDKLKIHELPRDSRPYERLQEYGEASLSDSELLAILLNSGRKGKTALDLAQQLLASAGGLRLLAQSSLAELQLVPGIGQVKAMRLKAAFELGRRLQGSGLEPGFTVTSPDNAADYLRPKLADLDHEEFHCLFLDCRKRIIRSELIASGGLDVAAVWPREIFRKALRANAHSIILTHNHPSGNPEPSEADLAATEAIVELGRKMGIPVIDHLIVAGDLCLSFRERGLLF